MRASGRFPLHAAPRCSNSSQINNKLFSKKARTLPEDADLTLQQRTSTYCCPCTAYTLQHRERGDKTRTICTPLPSLHQHHQHRHPSASPSSARPHRKSTKRPLCESTVTSVEQLHMAVLSNCHTAACAPTRRCPGPGRITQPPLTFREPPQTLAQRKKQHTGAARAHKTHTQGSAEDGNTTQTRW